MTFKSAAVEILRSEKRPMRVEDITDLALRRQLLQTSGKTPSATMGAQLYTGVKNNGAKSEFVQLGKNLWGLREWDLSVLEDQIQREERVKVEEQKATHEQQRRSVVGDPINVEGLTYAPLNENGVIYLFARLAPKLGYIIEAIQPAFPDAKGRRKTSKGWKDVWIEFEYHASSFKVHGHDPNGCDVIVCWENDWLDAPIEILALSELTRG